MLVNGVLGILLGVVIGAISSVMVISMLTILSRSGVTPRTLFQIAGELCAVPTFAFGGPWIGTRLLAGLNWDLILNYYVVSFCIAFIVLVSPVFCRFLVRSIKLVEDPKS